MMTTEMETVAAALAAPAAGLAWKRIAEALEEEIRAGQHAVGALLPPSAVLAERFGVHRHTVRQAFKHLAEKGLVSVERGRGTEVLAQRFPYRIGRRVSLRTNFGAAGIAVTGRIISAIRESANPIVAEALEIAPGSEVHVVRTLSLADQVPVSTGLHYLDMARFPDFPERLAQNGASMSAAFASAGIPDYLRLSTRLSARIASNEESALLALAAGSPVLQSIGVDALPDHRPIQFVVSVFAGPRMEMIIEPLAESPAP
ncbi:MAG: phosphonate metabolism transcriptional regulator PhnF [Beijerinckiaceae bacterium]|nr:phosphonate metabolism transcriptional regulator PhnF [Beijerinckiaceae bacterium]